MTTGRWFVFVLLIAFGGAVIVQPLHPLYHNHTHEHHLHLQAGYHLTTLEVDARCFIDIFQFYQRIDEEPASYTPVLISFTADLKSFVFQCFLPPFYLPYALRAPPYKY